MSTEEKVEQSAKDCLRIILDQGASKCLDEISVKLKAVGPYIKFYPSQLVSFIVSDFFATHFEKDFDVLVSEFFDSKAYIAAEVQRAKTAEEALEALKTVQMTIEKMKSQGRANATARASFGKASRAKKKAEISYENREIS